MVNTINDTTVASSDIHRIFDNIINDNARLTQRLTDVRNESNIFLCKVLRFYTYKDLAFVRILNNNNEVMSHISHDILDRTMTMMSMNNGTVKSDNTHGTYIIPYDEVYGIVAKVRWDNNNDEYCFISCVNIHDNNDFKSVIGVGEILLNVGDSRISITDERVNIITPRFFINGLPYDEPELQNYYDKDESDDLSSTRLELITERIDKLVEKNNLIEEDEEEI